MWLLNTKTLELFAFVNEEIPPYAILSHTWGKEEVSFQEIQAVDSRVRAKLGFEKISKCCELAVKYGLDYAWVDTCCIDKTSSAELSESINSMYSWYGQANVCYVFLSDVPIAAASNVEDSRFSNSRWFTRGWTLQELIAPNKLIFFSQEWEPIGTKQDLARRVSAITGIDQHILQDAKELQSLSIARRMSWAAGRNTTRVEDIAYCLMGLFDVNMPMLYGEGRKAFIRLQEEILKSTEDQSIFAWQDPQASADALCGLFAPHPRCFETTGDFHPFSDCGLMQVTNRGILVEAMLHETESGLTATFRCTESNKVDSFAFIDLFTLDKAGSEFARIRANTLGRAPRRGTIKPMAVKQNPKPVAPSKSLEGEQWFSITNMKFPTRWVIGGEKLSFFTASEHSAVRPLEEIGSLSIDGGRVDQRQTRIKGSPSDYLFKLPNEPNTVAVTLHLTARDQMGFGVWYHAEIMIGTRAGSDIAIVAVYRGENEEEDAETIAAETSVFSNAMPIPATVNFEMEVPLKVIAGLSWKDVAGRKTACVSLEVLDPSE